MFISERERERERERESTQTGEGKTERETPNPKQVPGSELSAWNLMQGSNSQTMRSCPQLKLDA